MDAPPPCPTSVLVIRHGEDIPRRPGRDEDSPLTDLGEAQAHAVACRLARRPVAALYTAPSVRARATAEVIGRAISREPVVIPNLGHQRYRQSLTRSERLDNALRWLSYRVAFGLGPLSMVEPFRIHDRRLIRGVAGLAAAHPGKTVAVVGYRPTALALLRGSGERSGPIPDMGSISEFRLDGWDIEAVSFGDTAHLAGLVGTPRP
ncbi:MAG: histidine phosphatase family protein [Dehalococcoidia bacterium]